MQGYNPNAQSCWVAGFSFGAWIGMQLLMRRPEIAGFVSVAPPASIYDFTFLAPCPSSGLIVHGASDDIVPEASAAKLAAKLQSQKNIEISYQAVPGANHFFTNHLDILTTTVDGYLDKNLTLS
jgi:alpha/beta superfamily hydrolase